MAGRFATAAVTLAVMMVAAGCVAPAALEDIETAGATDAHGFSDTSVFPGEYATKGDFARVLVEGAFGILDDEVVELQSEVDGATMQIGLVRPDVPEREKVPVIAFASPYLMPLQNLDFQDRLARLVENFVPHGYAVAFVPVRGTADTGGCMDLMGPSERADLDQAVRWLGEQEWSNGRVGMIGVSYDGSTPWEVASMGNPYLKTIVPVSGVNDIHHLMFHNGTPEFRGPLVLNALYYEYGFLQYNVANGRSVEHSVTGVVCPESFEGFAASIHSALTGERDPLGFWAERNSRPGVEANYEGSIFHVQGLQDWNVDPAHNIPWVRSLEDNGLVVKHLYGQWSHMWPDSRPEENDNARWDWAEILLHWFDRELKGLDVDVGPRVQVQDSEGAWRSEKAWPPADATPRTLHLTNDGRLADSPSEAAPAPGTPLAAGLAFASIPCDEERPTRCLRFTTDAVEEDLRFAGTPLVRVPVVPTGPGGHLTAQLYAVDGNNHERLGWGQIDLRFNGGGETMSLVTPGGPMVAEILLEPLDAVVPEGARLVLVLTQDAYGDHIYAPTTNPVFVQPGGEESTLTLLTFERGETAFFEPPGKV